eukprot:1317063-Karenia_brevis.AAC.1
MAPTADRPSRNVCEPTFKWQDYPHAIAALGINGDNMKIVNWINGACKVSEVEYTRVVEDIMGALQNAWKLNLVAPRLPHTDWIQHVYREFNKVADGLATQAILQQRSDVQ